MPDDHGDVEPNSGVRVQELPGGEYAAFVNRGRYGRMAEAYRSFFERMGESGREPRHVPALEVYRNDPAKTPADELETEIRLPLES